MDDFDYRTALASAHSALDRPDSRSCSPARPCIPSAHSTRGTRRTIAVPALGFLAALFAACGSSDSAQPTVPPASGSSSLSGVDSAPFGDALCGAASSDGTLYVSAEGAALTVLEADSLVAGGGPPRVLGRAPIQAAPHALVCDPPYVFVAGGTGGLWRVTIGDGADTDGAWPADVRIRESDGALYMDVASLDDHPAGRMVAAVTSARVGFGTSELVVVDRDPPHALRARVALVPPSGAPGAKAFAVVADPIEPARVYVAMGSAGIWRVDLADLGRPHVVRGPRFDHPDEFLGGEPAAALDVDCIRAGERTILFAAIDRGGVAQIDVSGSIPFAVGMPTLRPTLECIDGGGGGRVPFGFRVSAVGRADGNFLVAVSTNGEAAERLQNGPYSCFGRWKFDVSLPGPEDSPVGCTPHTFLLRGQAPVAMAEPVPPAFVVGGVGGQANARSAQLVARDADLLLLEQRFNGSSGFALPTSAWTSLFVPFPPRPAPYAGAGLAIVDGSSSAIDPGLLYFGGDGISVRPSGMPRFDIDSGRIEMVEGTSGLCPDSSTQFCNSPELAIVPPNPWTNGITGGATWVDASDPNREWFASGKSRVSQQCPPDPCSWTEDWCSDPWREEGNAPQGDQRPPGWEIVRIDSSGASAGAGAMDVRFWSIASPPDELGRTGRNYFGSAEGGVRSDGQRFLHLFRGAIRDGYIVCSATDLVQRALTSCTASTRGRGQRLDPTWSHSLRTHYELGVDDLAEAALTWRGEEFTLDVGGMQRTYIAVAAGWVLGAAQGAWADHVDRGSIVIYELTDVDATHPPVLTRILLGPTDEPTNFVAVRKAVLGGRTWLFAGDLGGGAHVFDVSASQLVDAAPADPSDPATAIAPTTSWYVTPDAYDGQRANVTDLELDLDTNPARPIVILGNARRGITVLDVATTGGANPTLELHEAEGSPIDTPGIVSGIVPFRRGGTTWFGVGDARCGIRVYRR